MNEKQMNAELRTDFGKNSARRLRVKGYIPAVIYSHGKSENISIPYKDFYSIFKGHISESIIFTLNITGKQEGAEQMAFVKDYLKDPITGEIQHIDLFKVTRGEKIHTIVPIEITGVSKGIKKGGVVEIMERELEVECLPMHLPEKIVIDVTDLDMNESIHAKDVATKDSLVILTNPETVIVSVHAIKIASLEVEAPAAAVEGEAAVETEKTSEKE